MFICKVLTILKLLKIIRSDDTQDEDNSKCTEKIPINAEIKNVLENSKRHI